MNRSLLFAACLAAGLAAAPAGAQESGAAAAKASDAPNAAPNPADDLAAIRATSEAFAAAFNRRDAKAVAALWTETGDYTDDAGRTLSGRSAIEKSYASFFAENRDARLSIIIDSLRLLSDNAAIEDGRTILDPPPPGAPAIGKYTVVHVKVGGEWLMSTVRDSRIETPSAYRRIADLEWLIGDWTAEQRGARTESVCRWVANKSFVERRYSVEQADGTTISGIQLIGWDPSGGRVESWTFSSDGGHAAGVWSPRERGWSAELHGVSGDGTPTTAMVLLTRLDDNAYAWKSVRRTAAGIALPDTDEVVIRRRTDSGAKASH